MKKKIIFSIIFLLMLVGCTEIVDEDTKTVKVDSHEIFDKENKAAQVHIKPGTSEYIEIEYNGERRYQLDVEIWKQGEVISKDTKIRDIELAGYNGISFEVDERNPELLNITIGMYKPEGYESANFDFSVDYDDSELKGRVESTYYESKTYDDTEDVLLWGLHTFNNSYEMFADGYDAAANMELSILFILRSEE